jgi:hypothetical protein
LISNSLVIYLPDIPSEYLDSNHSTDNDITTTYYIKCPNTSLESIEVNHSTNRSWNEY